MKNMDREYCGKYGTDKCLLVTALGHWVPY